MNRENTHTDLQISANYRKKICLIRTFDSVNHSIKFNGSQSGGRCPNGAFGEGRMQQFHELDFFFNCAKVRKYTDLHFFFLRKYQMFRNYTVWSFIVLMVTRGDGDNPSIHQTRSGYSSPLHSHLWLSNESLISNLDSDLGRKQDYLEKTQI